MSKETDKLFIQLNDMSNSNFLNEAFDLDSIAVRLNNLKGQLLTSSGLRNATLSTSDMELMRKARMAVVDSSVRVVTYPNIHAEQNYKINASVIIDFVMRRISEHAKINSDKHFDATATVQEGISFTLKYLTGKTPSRYLTIDQFKREYQLYTFGSFRKVQLYPKVLRLSTLAQRGPLIISFIENNLLYQQINSLNSYAKRIENDFLKLLKNNENLKYALNAYMSCIERSIRALINMYKIIRNTFVELQREYFNIFKQIINMNNIRSGSIYGECCTISNDYIKILNESIENMKSLNESIDSEIINDTKSDMYNNIKNKFNEMIDKKSNISSEIKNHIFKNLDRVSKIDPYEEYSLIIPDGLLRDMSNINIKKYIDSIEYIIYSTDNLSDLVNKSSNVLFGNSDINDINNLRKTITDSIIGNIDLKKVNFDKLTENVLKLIDYTEYIDNGFYQKINNYINNKKNIDFIKNIIIGSICIVDSIYFNILSMIQYFINALNFI